MNRRQYTNDELLDALDGRLPDARAADIHREAEEDASLRARMDDLRRLRVALKTSGALAHMELTRENRAAMLAGLRETSRAGVPAQGALPRFPGRWTRIVTWIGAAAATLLVALYSLDPPVSREAMDTASRFEDTRRTFPSRDASPPDEAPAIGASDAGEGTPPSSANPPEPRHPPRSEPVAETGGVRGDADGDGALTVADSVLILRAVLGETPGGAARYDFDRNGRIDARDYQLALRALLDEEIG